MSAPASQDSTSSKSVPIAAIAAPVVIGVLAIAGVVGLLFFLRRRKAASKDENPHAPPIYRPEAELRYGEVHEVQNPAQELVGDAVKYRYELESSPAELEGAKQADRGH